MTFYYDILSFRYIKGSELVQKLTAVAFDLASDYMTLQEWYAHQVHTVPIFVNGNHYAAIS